MADPQTDLRDSEEFPVGYGDIRLISSDQVIFHFQQWLLMYMSPVFKDMFTIGDAKESSNPPSVTLSEDSKTISMILRFIDPMKDNPALEFTILSHLLEAARKYQFGKIKDWVASWLNGSDPAMEAMATQFSTMQAIELLEVGTTFCNGSILTTALRRVYRRLSSLTRPTRRHRRTSSPNPNILIATIYSMVAICLFYIVYSHE
ncbi:hypothetical protein FRC18_006547 [Serendipita sp. 400]|nr:hypothetical protein FRC18_006547 [Serendipita sp. 400]